MTLHLITLHGCDDTTRVTVELTEAETRTAERIAAATRLASQYDCQPRMHVGPCRHPRDDGRDER